MQRMRALLTSASLLDGLLSVWDDVLQQAEELLGRDGELAGTGVGGELMDAQLSGGFTTVPPGRSQGCTKTGPPAACSPAAVKLPAASGAAGGATRVEEGAKRWNQDAVETILALVQQAGVTPLTFDCVTRGIILGALMRTFLPTYQWLVDR